MPRSHGADIDKLIQLLAKLPGLGPRSARRSALQMLKKKDSVMVPLAAALRDVADRVQVCTIAAMWIPITPAMCAKTHAATRR